MDLNLIDDDPRTSHFCKNSVLEMKQLISTTVKYANCVAHCSILSAFASISSFGFPKVAMICSVVLNTKTCGIIHIKLNRLVNVGIIS